MKFLLKKYFGYDNFRPLQEEIINNVLAGEDSFILMPTGGGKSLCYQLPALKFEGLTLVISPLIALMKDQVDSLKACGIAAEFINSTLTAGQIRSICALAENGYVKILYVAPERFALQGFKDFLKNIPVSLIAVDEAHCISEWGHDFRPDYRNLSVLKTLFPGIPVMALTATATMRVREDILNQLNIKKSRVFISSFNRENLNISVIEKKQAFQKLLNLLEKYRKESVIIYCFSRNETEELAADLKLNNFNAMPYHAGLAANDRRLTQEYFTRDKVNIIVATIAFGMGIDKPDVRLIVHYTYPKTIESYYQEIGRAGRDGLQSECVMFYTYADTRKHLFFINQITDANLRARAEEKLNAVMNYAELTTCRKTYLLKYFGEELKKDCGTCDVCLSDKETFDATIIAKKILSAVVRTENRFGKGYIIDVLMGKKIQKIIRNGHDALSVYGIVNDFSEDEMGQIINHLTNLNFLIKSEGVYPTLSVTPKGYEFLKSKEVLELPKPEAASQIKVLPAKGELDYNADLFERLRILRKKLAEEANVPPFVIFGDKALREMSYYFPADNANFLQISGVGERKLEQFGSLFLEQIKLFVEENNITAVNRFNERQFSAHPTVKRAVKPEYYDTTRTLLMKKASLESIAKKQGVTPSTVVNHIEKILDNGDPLDLEYLKLPSDRYEKIKEAFQLCGEEKLKPVFEYLNSEYSYDELKLARVLLRT